MRGLFLLLAFTFSLFVNAQSKISKRFSKKAEINVGEFKNDWRTSVKSIEAPSPDGEGYRSFLERQKQIMRTKRELSADSVDHSVELGTADSPTIRSFFNANPDVGRPNDNTVAISKDGFIVSCVNSSIYIYDTLGTELSNASLQAFQDSLGLTAYKFDPKVKYDPEADRFILVYLSGTTDETNDIVVAFSQTNDPTLDWNIYAIDGNPLDNGTWSDYPAIALSKNDFFITVNLLITGQSWQTGFDGTIVWQIDKQSGYDGLELEADLWNDIRHDGRYIRNMHPVQGGSGLRDTMYFLSNRNFDLTNDTIFFVTLNGHQGDDNSTLEVDALISDISYGVPPNGRQDLGFGLATNDARVLGAYWEGDRIEFVSNSINHFNGFSAIFHGLIEDIDNPSVDGRIISDSTDFGYPNIVYSGKYSKDKESIINFNYVHPDIYSSCAVIYYDGNNDTYSSKVTIKEGESFVNVTSSNNDRWGDYSGIQRVYHQPGKVVCTGTFGQSVNVNGTNYRAHSTLVAQLTSPDSLDLFPAAETLDLRIGPNPSEDIVNVFFDLPEQGLVTINVIDVSGRLVKVLFEDQLKVGENVLSFSAEPLRQGVYFIHFVKDGETIKSEKLVKN